MTKPRPSAMPVLWAVAAVALLFGGSGLLLLAGRGWYDRAFAAEYVPAELEIVRYATETRQASDDVCLIYGIVRPQHLEVTVSDREVDLTRIGDSQALVRMLPDREMVEGRVIPVRYWTGDPNSGAWLRPPLVTNAPVPTLATVLVRSILGSGLLGCAVVCGLQLKPSRAARLKGQRRA